MSRSQIPAGVALAALLLAPGGAAIASAVPRAPAVAPGSPPACTVGQLATWIDTQANGAAGSFYYNLVFTNVSVHACTLVGYPGVSAHNAAGRQLGRPAVRDTTRPPRAVVLRAAPVQPGGPVGTGGAATAVLRITDVSNFPAASCERATAVALRVYAPGQRSSRLVGLPFVACASPTVAYLGVQAVAAGSPNP